MNGRQLFGLVAGAALVLAGTACSGSNDSKTSTSNTSPADTSAAVATAAPAPTGAQTLDLKAGERGDQYYYEPKDLTARAGTIVVTLTNAGPDRRHTFNVRKPGSEEVLAKIDQTDVGQSAKVEFTITEPGTYEIFCSVRGHADRGQRGTLTVTSTSS